MELFEQIASKIVSMLLIYLLIHRALSNVRHRTRSLIIFIVGVFLGGAFLVAYKLDLDSDTMFNKYDYFIYIMINFSFAIFSIIYTFTKYRKNQFLEYSNDKRRYSESISRVHYKKFLYLVFEYKNEYLLTKRKETYSGMNIELKKGKFHDIEINFILKRYGVDGSTVTLYGEYVDTKKKEIYYAYLINLNKSIEIKKYESVYYSKIRFLEMSDFDKEIVYRILIKDKFEIEK